MSEPIIEVIGDAYIKKALFKKDTFRLVFTDTRVIFSHVTKEMQKEEQKEFAEELKGKTLKERVMAMLHTRQRINEAYLELSLEEIMNKGEYSFDLEYHRMKKVKKHASFADDDDMSKPATVTIKFNNDKIKLMFSDDRASKKTYKLLKQKI